MQQHKKGKDYAAEDRQNIQNETEKVGKALELSGSISFALFLLISDLTTDILSSSGLQFYLTKWTLTAVAL